MTDQEKPVEISEKEFEWYQNRNRHEEALMRSIFGRKYEEPSTEQLQAEAQRRKAYLIGKFGGQEPGLTLQALEDRYEQSLMNLAAASDRHLSETLNPDEVLTMKMRFGLEGGQVRTLKEVGEALGRSKSTAWRYEQTAIRKLRTADPFAILNIDLP